MSFGKQYINMSLDGVLSPDFLKVTEVDDPVFSDVVFSTQVINGRDGSMIQNAQLDSKEIKVSFVIDNDTNDYYTIENYKRELAYWLSRAVDKDVELILGNETKIKYYVRIRTRVDLKRFFQDGEGTITFFVPNPIGTGETREQTFSSAPNDITTPYQIDYQGTYKSYPKISFKLTKNITDFQVVTDDQFIDFGEPLTLDKTIDTYNEWLVDNPCESTNGWNNSVACYGATLIEQDWEVKNGIGLVPSGGMVNEGSSTTGWYATAKELQLQGDCNNFQFHTTFHITTNQSDVKTNLKFHMMLKDTNNKNWILTEFVMDSTSNNYCYINYYFFDTNGAVQKKIYDHTRLTFPANWFYGKFRVSRMEGNVYRFYIDAQPKVGASMDLIWSHVFTDGAKTYSNRKPGRVQVAFMRYGKNPTSNMELRHISVKNLDPHTVPTNKVPMIAKAGDEITIDNETGDVYKNEEIWIDSLNASSTFIYLDPRKVNGILIAPSNITNKVTISWEEKFY